MKNVVQDLTSAGIDWQREKWQSGLGSKFIHQGEKNAAKYADEVIVLSKGVQDYFKETYGRETHFIPNGVNRPQIREASLITDKFGLKKDSYILFLGRLVPEKGIRYLIEAFKNVKTDKKLVIAGGSSDTDYVIHLFSKMGKNFSEDSTFAQLEAKLTVLGKTLSESVEEESGMDADGNMSKEEFIRQRDAYRVQEDERMAQIQRLRTEKNQIFLPVRKDADNLQTVVSAAEEAGDVMNLSQNVVETFMNLIAELSTGGKTPDGCKIGAPQKVIYQCSEDGVSDTIKPRLERYGADCRKIAFINEEVYNGLTLDDERIRQAIIEFRPRLVVIDPIQAYLGSDSDLQIAGRARKLMRRLGMWAAGYDCAIVLIGHLNKKEGSKGLYRSLGSIDVVAAARSVLQVERDTENPDIRIVHSGVAGSKWSGGRKRPSV